MSPVGVIVDGEGSDRDVALAGAPEPGRVLLVAGHAGDLGIHPVDLLEQRLEIAPPAREKDGDPGHPVTLSSATDSFG